MNPSQVARILRGEDEQFQTSTRRFRPGRTPYPLPKAPSSAQLESVPLEEFMLRNDVAALLVIKRGQIVAEHYRLGNDETTKWKSFSIGKAIVSTLVGAALKEGSVGSLEDPVSSYIAELKGTAYEETSIRNLLQMSSGVKYSEDPFDENSELNRIQRCVREQKAGGILDIMRGLERIAPPGSRFSYHTGETHLLGMVVSAATGRTLSDYLAAKIWSSFGMEHDGDWVLESENGQEFGGGSVSMTLRDYGRFALFFLNGGEQVLPPGWKSEATHPRPDSPQVQYGAILPNDPVGYGYLWWCLPARSEQLQHKAPFFGQGIFGQFLYVDPATEVIVVVWSAWPQPHGRRAREVRSFLEAVSSGD